ncbi:MFS transporter [Paenibacillus sp. HB172176]|uniref:MFS transporter n=1 Tax=Paenibacillus sp. HB172176 TaxID=2493690 RepID=UPI00143BE827|nr:MFS transporter [Paenibacillus sp. HB172176]
MKATHSVNEAAAHVGGKTLRQNRAFVFLISGNTIAVFGDCFSGVALSLWVLQTTGSAKMMAAVQICYMVVNVLLGSFAGTVTDLLDRRMAMLVSDMLRATIAAMLGISLFLLHAPFYVMLVLVTVSAFSSLFQAPAFHTSVTHLVGRDRLQEATSIIHLTDNIARIAGLSMAGVIVALFGGFAAMLANSATFLLSAACVLAAGKFTSPQAQRREQESVSLLKEWRQGLAYIVRDPLTRSLLLLNPLLIMFFMSSLMLIQVLAVNSWKAGPISFGLIEMCIPLGYMLGAGMIIGLAKRLGRRGWLIFAGMLLLGPIFSLIAMMDSALPALPFILLGGILFAFCSMLMQIILRTEVQIEMQGRIYGFMGAVTSVAPMLGLTVSSVLADRHGVHLVLGWQGLLMLIVGTAACLLFAPIRTYN